MGTVPGGSRDAGAERGRHGDPSEVPTKSGAARSGRTAKGETGTDGCSGWQWSMVGASDVSWVTICLLRKSV